MTAVVVPHDPAWASAFEVEARQLEAALGTNCLRLHHIGSTAISGIFAKPIIDILGVVQRLERLDAVAGSLEALGYEAMGAYGIDGRRYFRKQDETGRRTHHMHVFEAGSPHIERHLAFRDYLRHHPEIAAEYSAKKLGILEADQLYQETKDRYVSRLEAVALAWYRSAT